MISHFQDIATIGNTVRKHETWFHTDATQAAGKIPVDFLATKAHLMTLSAHKIYGPQETRQLDSIQIQSFVNGGWQLVRQYILGHGTTTLTTDSYTCSDPAHPTTATSRK